jgi:hypothetical protein
MASSSSGDDSFEDDPFGIRAFAADLPAAVLGVWEECSADEGPAPCAAVPCEQPGRVRMRLGAQACAFCADHASDPLAMVRHLPGTVQARMRDEEGVAVMDELMASASKMEADVGPERWASDVLAPVCEVFLCRASDEVRSTEELRLAIAEDEEDVEDAHVLCCAVVATALCPHDADAIASLARALLDPDQ